MREAEVLKIFEASHALLQGHFGLSSGNHSNRYLQCAMVTQYPMFARDLADALVRKLALAQVDCVLGPAVGGIVIAQEVAHAMIRQGHTNIRSIFCERQQGVMTLRRGFVIHPGERVLVVEDVITTGGSVLEAVQLARQSGGEVAAIGSFVDRSVQPPFQDLPFHALLRVEADIYPPESCPLCKQGLPMEKPGSRTLKT
jgi:orotate phosphoribosyltransferase